MNSSDGRTWAFGLVSVYLLGMTTLSLKLSLTLILGFWLATGGTYWCYLAWHTLPRDLNLLVRGLKLLFTMFYVKTFDINIVKAFRGVLKKYPNRVMFVNASTSEEWTYAKVGVL